MNDRYSTLRQARNKHLSLTFGEFWETQIIPNRDEINGSIDNDIAYSLREATSDQVSRCLETFPVALDLTFMKDAITDVWIDQLLNHEDQPTPMGQELSALFKGCPHSLTNARKQPLANPEERVFSAGINTLKSRILNPADRIFAWRQISDRVQAADIIRNSINMVLMPSSVQIEQFPQKKTWESLDPIQLNEAGTQLIFSSQAKEFLNRSRTVSKRKCPAREAMVNSPYIVGHKIPLMQDLMYWLADRIERPIDLNPLNKIQQ